MDKKGKPSIDVLIGLGKPSKGGDDGETDAAQAVLDAIEEKDASALAGALKDFMAMCDEEYEEEGE